jgi:BMFP domain-containing protein YqiC
MKTLENILDELRAALEDLRQRVEKLEAKPPRGSR